MFEIYLKVLILILYTYTSEKTTLFILRTVELTSFEK